MKLRLLILALFFLGVAGVGWLTLQRASAAREQVAPPVVKPGVVRCAPLVERSYVMTESFYGLIEPRARVDMAFQIPGRISQLGTGSKDTLRENDCVTKGQVLAMLEPLRYEAAQAQAKAKMEEAKAAMSAAQAVINDATARLDNAKKELATYKSLVEKGAGNQRELEKADMAVKLYEAQLEGAKAQMSAAMAMHESGRAGATMANVNLQDATLKAPMDAVVASVPVEIGAMVAPGQRVVALVDVTKVKLVVGVIERKLPLVKKGQKVSVEIQALAAQANRVPDAKALAAPREGTINIVPPAADQTTGLFNVEIELDNPDNLLRPGMIGKATVTVLEKRAIAIPLDAVGKSGEDYWAFFVAEGYEAGIDLGGLGKAGVNVPTAVAKRVILKPIVIDKEHLLVSDLPAGLSRLVIEGQSRLTDGQPLTIVGDAPASGGVSPAEQASVSR